MIRALDLFAGGGGVAVAMRALGLDATHVELDAAACATLRAMGEPRVFEGDVRALQRFAVPGIYDLVWSSHPCQRWSRATSRTRAQHADGWPWALDVIDATQPRMVAIENVKDAPRLRWVRDLEARGYEVAHGLVNAMYFGVPQTRTRALVLAVRGERRPRMPAPTSAPRPMREALEPVGGRVVYLRGTGRAASEPWRLDAPAPTVTTTEAKGTRASAASGWTFHGGPDRASDATFLATGLRRISTTEAARLQGFPEGHPFQGTVDDRYRQIGNAVPPPSRPCRDRRRTGGSMTPRWLLPLGMGAAMAAVLATFSGPREAAAAPTPSAPPSPGPSPARPVAAPPVPAAGDDGAWTGTAFVRRATGLPADAREALVLDFVRRGAIPASLRQLRPVTVSERGHTATVFVMPDVLALGVDGDRFRPALTVATAQRAADLLGMALPTEKLSRMVYGAAEVKVPMRAFGAPRDTFARHVESDAAIAARIARAGALETAFVAGHSKDYVVGAPRARNPQYIAIYGAWDAAGARIQPSSGRAHALAYRDYSQRVRLVAPEAIVDGARRPLAQVLGDPAVAFLLHDEGAVAPAALRYPT